MQFNVNAQDIIDQGMRGYHVSFLT